ncbi:DUF6790 family protein [Estrella lausannensis]|uniref:Conserved putative membrane protein n=1 Tax=Estrella lausannensis TaxID=483423 RepID=A0A0H5DRG0_9BACT|nr:DUF6790 family protein [Estrella lausannensis]CRX38269.1 Conserved putative membrane protein [Estrella lausannensis]
MLPLYLLITSVVLSSLHAFVAKRADPTKNFTPILLAYLIFFNIGIMGLLGFYGHAFMADEIARLIGWPTGSPFQSEIAAANLSYGVIGVIAPFMKRPFWYATIIGNAVFLIGALVVHIHQYFAFGNIDPYNIGVFVWVDDLIVPLILLFLGMKVSRQD